MIKSLKKLMQNLNYEFNDTKLLSTALRHRSIRINNNERLEFLGDSILNCIISEALYRHHAHVAEGLLSRLRALLVKEETLVELAKDFSLGEFLVLGTGELKSGGSKRSSILADAMEAVIGAIFLDADFDVCRTVVLKWYESRLQKISFDNEVKDPKTALQEYLQSKKKGLPIYVVTEVAGESHSQLFHVRCELQGSKLTAEGKGVSRRKAEQEAAEMMLKKVKK